MDMLVLFMLFCSVPPLVLWSRRRAWALAQLPLLLGMWLYPFAGMLHVPAAVHVVLTVLFYGNLVFTEAALVRVLIDYGNKWKARSDNSLQAQPLK
jgi:hypothetical protein